MKALIFDMDGVLVDNADLHLEAFVRLADEIGADYDRKDVLKVFGRRNDEMLPALLGRELSSEELEALADKKESIYRDLIRDQLEERAVAGVVDFIRTQASRYPMAVATSGPRENVKLVLSGLGIEDAFRGIVTGQDVSRGKPDPEVFLAAAESLGVRADETLVFEDSPSGVEAALRSGARCIALATTHDTDELQQLNPERVVPDFQALAGLDWDNE